MGAPDLFSRRREAAKPAGPLTYELSDRLRGQLVHVLGDAMGELGRSSPTPAVAQWEKVWRRVCSRHGVLRLVDRLEPPEDCMNCLLQGPTEMVLDVVEACLQTRLESERPPSDGDVEQFYIWQWYRHHIGLSGAEAVTAVNDRFRENGTGYEFTEGRIVELASAYTHSQMVEPALILLRESGFEGAHDEFLRAHQQLRAACYDAAITQACKAFESAMKTVCARKEWQTNPSEKPVESLTAQPLVHFLKGKGFFPHYLDNAMSGLVNLLGSGVNNVRNQSGHSHGQGEKVVPVDRHLAEFAIHQAAANILFLVQLLSPR